MTRRIKRALLCASLPIATLASPAAAQQIDRIIAFGDSYNDTGNAFALGYANPQALAIYPTRRFSGGSNYIDTLSQILQVPVENFAIGGAFGGSNNGTLCFDSFYAPGTSPLCGRGLQYEVDQFLNVGTQSTVFPNAITTFTSRDLLTVSIGGNDARVYQSGGGTLAGAGAAGTAAAAATTVQLDRLAAQGTPTISFLALNGAVAPEVANNPTAQAIRGAYSTAYYNALQPTLAHYAANGSVVHYLDGQLLLQNVSANPQAFGITKGLVCPIFPNTTCVADSSGYLFYGDALHLTSQGFAIVARYVAAQLAAPPTLAGPSELGFDTARQWGRTLTSRNDLYRGDVVDGLRVYAVGDYFSRNATRTDQSTAFDIKGYGGTIGAEYGMAGGLVGIAANYSKPKLTFGTDSSRDRGKSWQIGAYGNVAMGGFFGQAYLGYGNDDHRIERLGVLESLGMEASPDGSHVVAGAKGGYLMPFAGMSVGPIVAVDYARAKVDGYTEAGDAALTLNVEDQSLKSVSGQIGVEVRGELAGFHPFADLTLEHDFTGDDQVIAFSQTSAPTIVNSWHVARGQETYGRFSAGGSASLTSGISVDAFVSTTFGRDHGNEVGGQVGVKARF
jgi:uncharacterized protein YhjY with autotransporter beta-barrel domain/phospholipase/lecithinase/hemolysin